MSELNIPEEYIKKYGSKAGCKENSICDFSYVSDICHLQRGYDCPECPKRKALREQMDKDVANNPAIPKIMADMRARSRRE